MFGLVGVLLVVGVIVYWMGAPGGSLDQAQTTIKTGEVAREQVSQIAGHDSATGGLAMNSATFEMLTSNGRPASLAVKEVIADGAYARYFGIQKGDIITAIEYQGFKRAVRELDNANDGRDQVAEAYQRRGSLTIKRNNQEMTLPVAAPAPAPGTPPAQQPRNSVQRQLEQIQQGVQQ
jgi:hypothetical protein